jgi:hypothetical protein
LVSPAGNSDFGRDYRLSLPALLASTPGLDRLLYQVGAANPLAVRWFFSNFLLADRRRLTPTMVQAYLTCTQQPQAQYAALASLSGAISFDLANYIGQLSLPTAVVLGQKSRFLPAAVGRRLASLNPQAIFRTPITLNDYLGSRMLSDPIRLLDCVPIVNGGLAYVVTSAQTARALTDRPVYLLGCGEANNYYQGSRTLPDITATGFTVAAPKALRMAGVDHKDIDLFLPYDDYPFIAMMTLEDWGFCGKGEGGRFVDEHDLRFDGDFPLSTDGGQLSGGQPGGAIGGFMPLVEAVTQLRGEAGARQVPGASIGAACGFGGIPYGRPGRSCVSLVFAREH